MMSDTIFVKLYIPKIDMQYDLLLPINRKLNDIILLIEKAINDFCGGYYNPENVPLLYDKITAKPFDLNITVYESTIRNGSEIILI